MRRRLSILLVLVLLFSAVPVLYVSPVYSVAGLDNRTLFMGTSVIAASTTYDFQFDITIGGVIGSIQFEFCSNDPLPLTPCTPSSGFDISGATLTGQTGETGFTIDPGVTANDLLLTRAPAAATPQTVTYSLDSVVNPDTVGSYYVRVLTYASSDGSGPTTEEAGLALAITDDFSVTAFVPPYLTFCAAITITANNCATATGSLIDFGVLNENQAKVATSQFAGATNGVGGVAVSIIGTTMTSGIHTIDALSTRDTSDPGSNQFGLNLRDNSFPNSGSNPTGPGTMTAVGDYNVPNEFAFNNGDQIASSPLSTDFSTLTVTYLVNIDPDQNPGTYTSTITYVATATF